MAWTDVQLAYSAGYMDGEGSISISLVHRKEHTRVYPKLKVSISNIDGTFLRDLYDEFGGGLIHRQQLHTPNGRPIWRWTIDSKKAERFIREIQPYLRQKSRHAELALEFRSLVNPGGQGSDHSFDRRWQIREEILHLNKRGKAAM